MSASSPPVPGALFAAAVAGLLSGAGCSSDAEGSPAAEGPRVLSEKEDTTMTFERFQRECAERGGFVQTHAVCAGVNACRGMSYNKYDYVLTEHTCKGMNTCGGMSCVVLQADQGRESSVLYEDRCAGCHGSAADGFTLYVPPGTPLEAAVTVFRGMEAEDVGSVIAFGLYGRNRNGTAYANMPAQYEHLSRAEILGLVDYVRSLTIEAEEFGIVGQTEDIEPP